MLRNRDKVLSLQEVKDTLRKTNDDLLQKLTTKEVLAKQLNQAQQQRFDIVCRLLLQKAQLGDNTKKLSMRSFRNAVRRYLGKAIHKRGIYWRK